MRLGPERTTVPEVQPATADPPAAAAQRALFAACLELQRALTEVVRATEALEPVPGIAAERRTTVEELQRHDQRVAAMFRWAIRTVRLESPRTPDGAIASPAPTELILPEEGAQV